MATDPHSPPPSEESPRPTLSPASERKPARPTPTHAFSSASGVSAAQFYSTGHAGSSRTGYMAPDSPPFREPQLMQDDTVTELISQNDPTSWNQPTSARNSSGTERWTPTWDDPGLTPWDSGWSGAGTWGTPANIRKVNIDGRDDFEELNWCDADLRAKCRRPGPGMLPPILADALHDPDHALYSVSLTQPPTGTHPLAPTPEESRMAIPHANAYYCKEHNGWILLAWRSSSVLPPLARDADHPLPDLARRKLTSSCVGDGEQPFGQVNTTHHWHRYERVVDACALNPPFTRDDTLLDLYICCQCSTYCFVSEVIPGVIPLKLVEDFTRDKYTFPVQPKTAKASVLTGWETFLTIVENRLWRNEQRTLPVQRPRFQQKVGWSPTTRQIFEALDFPIQPSTSGTQEEIGVNPPSIDPATPEGKSARAKLLRAWVEISAWLAICQKSIMKPETELNGYIPQVLGVQATEVREMYQTGIGAHVSQIPRGLLPVGLVGVEALNDSWAVLGMTPGTYSWELLSFAYLAQCRCDPARTPLYFTHLCKIVSMLINVGEAPAELQQLIVEERERYRYTHDDLQEAIALFGFGKGGQLDMELDEDVDDKFVLDAWRSARRLAWRDPIRGAELRLKLNDALRWIADERGSAILRKAWDEEKGSGMTPDAAYSTLEVPKDVDETMLLAVYSMRVEDQPGQAEKMRDALTVIAEVTDSVRLRQFLATGSDPGDTTQITSPDMPRGLNQLGNTCYLNSLLQYFYTIKDLRGAIAPLASSSNKLLDDSKLTDDDLKRHRVGGRMVTRREILRSKKFVSQLAGLFWDMEFSEVPAVTPTLDLAKLALVTSQDEEEDDQDRAGTDSSNDTDATLVEDAPPRISHEQSSPPVAESPTSSILGKRTREPTMDVDASSASQPASPGKQTSPSGLNVIPPIEQAVASSSKLADDGDIEMQDDQSTRPKPPPLPARKFRQTDDSVMMFGRQHDVSECMDNCIFQIETALLDFQEMTGAEDDKTSIVKRLFYGKKRQRLTPLTPSSDKRHKASMHEKEDLFSHIHVNVSDDGLDLYDCLGRYFDDVVELDGEKKRMEVSLVDLPPLLQIQLQRVQFDRETQQAYKSQAYVQFGETIYMDRFLESADSAKKTRAKAIQAELSASRERTQRLTQGKHAPFAAALEGAADFLSKQDAVQLPEVDEELLTELRKETESISARVEQERKNAATLKEQLEEMWREDTTAGYELTSVFIHRGSSPSWGHYFFYSRNLPGQPDQWFKYNDSDVSAVSKDEVLADTTGLNANPYMLVFARKGCEAIETVHRFDPEKLLEA